MRIQRFLPAGAVPARLGAALVFGGLAIAAPQASATTFDFSYDIPSPGPSFTAVDAFGVLTADPTSTPGQYLVTAISGTRNGEAITGLIPVGDYSGNDNLIIFPATPSLTGNGLSYTVAGAGDGNGDVNVYYSGSNGYTELNGKVEYTPDFTLTEVNVAPEPASLALLGTGLLGLALLAGRRKGAGGRRTS